MARNENLCSFIFALILIFSKNRNPGSSKLFSLITKPKLNGKCIHKQSICDKS